MDNDYFFYKNAIEALKKCEEIEKGGGGVSKNNICLNCGYGWWSFDPCCEKPLTPEMKIKSLEQKLAIAREALDIISKDQKSSTIRPQNPADSNTVHNRTHRMFANTIKNVSSGRLIFLKIIIFIILISSIKIYL